jgi:hypothetical protein
LRQATIETTDRGLMVGDETLRPVLLAIGQ